MITRGRKGRESLVGGCHFPKMNRSGNSTVVHPELKEEPKQVPQDLPKSDADHGAKAPLGAEDKGAPGAAVPPQANVPAGNNVAAVKTEGNPPLRPPGENVDGDAKAVHAIFAPPTGNTEQKDQPKPKGPEVNEISLEDIELDSTEVDFNHSRIGRVANLEGLRCVEVLVFRNNLIKKIENVHMLTTLKEIEFYDNQITKIENLDALVNLQILDISFNRLTRIENLDKLVNLKKLFLVNNRITKIENLDKLVNLEMLELGANRIKAIENLHTLVNLKSLFLGKNRISKLENLEHLAKLELLSIQSNRIVKLEGLQQNRNLCHLYMSHNGIEQIENLDNNVKLETLDLASNRVKRLANLAHLVNIEEFWFNNNEIDNFADLEVLRNFPKLATVYLHSNPIEKDPMYRRKIMMISPTVTQIDATMCRKQQ